MRGLALRAVRWTMVSVSEVDWKIAPCPTSSVRKVWALVRLPLWAMASPPPARSAKIGWMLLARLPPAVE